MNGPPERLAVVRGWIQKAENDLKNAAWTLKIEGDCPTDTACFHAQQCIEKYLKALLSWRGTDFPKTHDLGRLLLLLPASERPALDANEAGRLSEYATVMRYPGDDPPIPLAEARAAVKIARQIRRHVRLLLPPELLRRAGKNTRAGE